MRERLGRLLALVGIVALLLGGAAVRAPAGRAADEACFPQTGQCVRGRFLAYWQAHGGLALNGYPLSDERQELLEDGKTYTVQYFERVRLEYHPENPPPWDVELGQFGRRALNVALANPPTVPVAPLTGQVYFPATGHNLGGAFLAYWRANGGLAQFGYPLTDPFPQLLEDSRTHVVQYFERARFEAHPENAPPWDIELGQFGRSILHDNELLAGDRSFDLFYISTASAQALLGPPLDTARQAPASYLGFEHGAMIDGERGINVFCPEQYPGRPDPVPRLHIYRDTWTPDQPVGGGPGPRPGLYAPTRGFGTVWRANPGVRACLGYATAPAATAYTAAREQFGRPPGGGNFLLSAVTPEGKAIYVVSFTCPSPDPAEAPQCGASYARYPDPLP
ncbi:MAG TPA: hypothetical protein VFW96_21360 [Thermomicrobiales bacterium]|nr:hypothetical protein [Thermomicrobiales bacterium]